MPTPAAQIVVSSSCLAKFTKAHNTADKRRCGGCSADVGGAEAASKGMTLAGFRQWTKSRAPSFVRTVRAMVSGGGTGGAACPRLEGGSGAALLQPPWAWALSGALAPKQTASIPVTIIERSHPMLRRQCAHDYHSKLFFFLLWFSGIEFSEILLCRYSRGLQ